MVSRMRRKTTKSMRRISSLYWASQTKTRGRRRVGRSPAVGRGGYGRVATVQWQGQDQRQRQRQGQRQESVFRGAQETSCRAEEPYQLSSVRYAWARDDTCPKNAKNDGTLQSLARVYLTIGCETSGFDLSLTGDEMSSDATALVAHARLDASDIPVETPPKAPPGTRRPRKAPRVIPSPPPPTPQCTGGCKEYSRRGTDAKVERFTCVDCGFVTTGSKGATEDPAMCLHVETDTRGSSKILVRHTC